ncbi:hypothetical protein C8R47DRAFT_1070256 [Mycena vitilis]|nr:hypothetical protein C8R47DRAFT_1070256 [Mycena vitilis]
MYTVFIFFLAPPPLLLPCGLLESWTTESKMKSRRNLSSGCKQHNTDSAQTKTHMDLEERSCSCDIPTNSRVTNKVPPFKDCLDAKVDRNYLKPEGISDDIGADSHNSIWCARTHTRATAWRGVTTLAYELPLQWQFTQSASLALRLTIRREADGAIAGAPRVESVFRPRVSHGPARRQRMARQDIGEHWRELNERVHAPAQTMSTAQEFYLRLERQAGFEPTCKARHRCTFAEAHKAGEKFQSADASEKLQQIVPRIALCNDVKCGTAKCGEAYRAITIGWTSGGASAVGGAQRQNLMRRSPRTMADLLGPDLGLTSDETRSSSAFFRVKKRRSLLPHRLETRVRLACKQRSGGRTRGFG